MKNPLDILKDEVVEFVNDLEEKNSLSEFVAKVLETDQPKTEEEPKKEIEDKKEDPSV